MTKVVTAHASNHRRPPTAEPLSMGGRVRRARCRTPLLYDAAGMGASAPDEPTVTTSLSRRRDVSAGRSDMPTRVEVLGSYVCDAGCAREVIGARRSDGSVLIVDRDATTLGDRRLVAHLAADEPDANATLTCALYLQDPARGQCRRIRPEDLTDVSDLVPDTVELPSVVDSRSGELVACADEVEAGRIYSLDSSQANRRFAELRWHARQLGSPTAAPRPVSLREVVAAIESYEPVYTLSLAALAAHEHDPTISVASLRHELERMRESPVVLNRRLREAVLAAIERGSSMSEIALRCDRIKRDGKGNCTGETSWLARRIGVLPASGSSHCTPWIHSEVLALIAREGLGISPHEVEL